MSGAVRTAEDDALDAVVAGHERRSVCRARPPRDDRSTAGRPWSSGRCSRRRRDVRARHADGRHRPMQRRRPRRAVRGDRAARRRATRQTSPTASACTRAARTRDVVDPVSVRPGPDRLRPAPVQRRHALPRVGEARRAPPDDRRGDRRALRRLGAQRAARQRHRRLQPLGRPRRTRCAGSCRRASGRSSFPI